MTLKYKIGDEVVLGENVDFDYMGYFTPGTIMRISEMCYDGSVDEHYTVRRVDSKGGLWWVNDSEINHQATEELQKSNETGDIVGKIEAVRDDNAKGVQTPGLKENAPQTAPQSVVESSFSNSYSTGGYISEAGTSTNDSIIARLSNGKALLVFQQERDSDIQEIRLDFDALGVVFSAANELIVQYKEKK